MKPVLAAIAIGCAHAADEASDDLKLSFWDRSVNIRGALGYKDNVLLSNLNRDGSAFWLSALDFALLRANLDGGPSVSIFASAEDRRYFSAADIDKEQVALGQAKFLQEVGSGWSLGAVVQYLYADQVFDASSTEQLFQTLPVKSHNLQFSPIIQKELPWNSELELKLIGERQLFDQNLDDYWAFGPELTFTKKYGNRSTAALSYRYQHRMYDSRRGLDLDRVEIPNSVLEFDQHEWEFTLNHSWDVARHWRSRLRVLFEINQDNGVGFYDYYRERIMGRFGYFAKSWQATLEGKILHYDYQKQPVPGTGEIRETWNYVVAARVEKTIWKKVKIFADDEYEVVNSNYSLEEYNVNTVSAGVDWEF